MGLNDPELLVAFLIPASAQQCWIIAFENQIRI